MGSIRLSEFKRSLANNENGVKSSSAAVATNASVTTPTIGGGGLAKERDRESFCSGLMTIDDEIGSYSTTFDETTRSMDYTNRCIHHSSSIASTMAASASAAAKRKRNKLNKRNRDIKLALLMLFSGAFLVFVLPETVLKIYQFHFVINNRNSLIYNSTSTSPLFSSQDYSNPNNNNLDSQLSICNELVMRWRLNLFLQLFHMLKLIYFSSNFLAYLALTTFSRVKRAKKLNK
jgi:hypothetical protein